MEVIPLYPLAPLVFLAAASLFLLQMARHLRVMAWARPDPRTNHPEARFASLIRYSIVQVRMFRDVPAGLLHAAIFWGFILLTIGTLDRIAAGLVSAAIAWPLDGWLWRGTLVLQNVMLVSVLGAVAVSLFRRLVVRPRRLTLSRDGLVILVLIGAVVVTELLAEAFRIAARPDEHDAWAFAASLLATSFTATVGASVGTAVLEMGYAAFFWANIILVSAFLVYLPSSKHLHIATAFFNTAFRKLEPRGRLPDLDLEAEDRRFGVRDIEDLAWKDLLDGFTCTECGRCQDACPAWATGKPLNPKTMIMGLRDMTVRAEVDLPLVPFIRPAAVASRRGSTEHPIVGDAISFDAVWDCVTCGACVEACPVLIEHVDKIVGLRRDLVLEQGRFPAELTAAFTAMERHGDPWGQPASARLDWARGLPFEVPTAAAIAAGGPDAVAGLECLYWVGCAAAFDDRNRRVARAVVSCLSAAGVRFAVLGQEESCTGDPARRLGNEYVFQLLATANIATLDGYGPPTIVTACPHCFNTLGNEYPAFGGHYDVVHHSTYLASLVEAGRLRIDGPDDAAEPVERPTVTYHDACYLSRYNDIIADPRKMLTVLPGVELREMEKHGRETVCCGAGGGHMWMEEARGTRMNAERTRQALETGAGTVATACPFCLVMLRDGLEDSGRDAAVRPTAMDIAELLAGSLAD